jgi:hypothetical protein
MEFTLFLTQYALWHYGRSMRSLFSTWGNFLWFTYNFFSIPLLLRTLFSPFQRIGEEYKHGLDLGAIFSTLLVNTLMRCVGAFARTIIIAMGIVFLAFVAVSGAMLFVAWVLLPCIILAFLLLGIHGLILWIR